MVFFHQFVLSSFKERDTVPLKSKLQSQLETRNLIRVSHSSNEFSFEFRGTSIFAYSSLERISIESVCGSHVGGVNNKHIFA